MIVSAGRAAVEPPRRCPGCGRIVAFCERCGRPLALDLDPANQTSDILGTELGVGSALPSALRVGSGSYRCAGCGQYTGEECWNAAAARCFNCAPDIDAQFKALAGASQPRAVCATCGVQQSGLPLPGAPGAPEGLRGGDLRAPELLRTASRRVGQGLLEAAGRVTGAMLGVAGGRSLRPLALALIALLAAGGLVMLTRQQPGSGDGSLRPLGVAASATPHLSSLTSAPAAAKPSPVPSTSSTPPLTGEPRVEVSRSTVRAWRDPTGTVRAQVVVEVRNAGAGTVDLRSGTASYTLKGTDGNLLYEGLFPYSFPATLRPTEIAYLVDTATLEFVEPSEVGPVEIALKPAPAAAESARLRVEDVAWRRAPTGGGLEVTGRILNSGGEVDDALVAVILLDAEGALLGAVYDNTDAAHIAAGGSAEFRTAYPGTPPLTPSDVASVRAVAFAP